SSPERNKRRSATSSWNDSKRKITAHLHKTAERSSGRGPEMSQSLRADYIWSSLCSGPAHSMHADPERAAEIGRKGGKRNLKLYDCGPQNVSIPESPADVKRMLAETMA